MPTAIGLIFTGLAACFFFLKDDRLFALTVFSSIFTASSIISITGSGLLPYYFIAGIFALQSIYHGACRPENTYPFRGKKWVTWFIVVCLLSAVTLPVIFAGIPVYDPHLGIDLGFFIQEPLHFSHSNLTYAAFLLLGASLVWGASRRFTGPNRANTVYLFAFYFLIVVVFAQWLLPLMGLEFPYKILQTHQGVAVSSLGEGDMYNRFPGTFTEPSGAGELLACCTSGFIAARLKYSKPLIPVLIGIVALLLVRSSGSLLAVAVTVIILLLSTPVFRPPYINLKRVANLFLILASLCGIVAIVLFTSLRDSLIDVTFNKSESGSFLHRLTADAFALTLFVRTYGLGVGVGSNRPSSIVTSLLSTVGIVGCILFFGAYILLLSNAKRKNPWLLWAGLGFILTQISSGPDFDSPWLWSLLAIAVRMGAPDPEQAITPVPRSQPSDSSETS